MVGKLAKESMTIPRNSLEAAGDSIGKDRLFIGDDSFRYA